MSKEYNGISAENAVRKSKNKTFSLTAVIEPAPPERFGMLISGRVRAAINDFTAGKGDSSTKVYFNFEIGQIYEMLLRAGQTWNAAEYKLYSQKIYGNNQPDREGLVPAFHASVTFDSSRNYPWTFRIWNGRAAADPGPAPGTFKERAQSFKISGYAEVSMANAEIYAALRNVVDYIDNYKRLAADRLIPAGEEALRSVSRGEKGISKGLKEIPETFSLEDRGKTAAGQGDVPAQQGAAETQASPPARQTESAPQHAPQAPRPKAEPKQEQAPPGQRAQARPAQQSAQQQKPAKRQSGTMDVVITGNFWAVEGGFVSSKFLCRGKEYAFLVPGDAFEGMREALEGSLDDHATVRIAVEKTADGLVCNGLG